MMLIVLDLLIVVKFDVCKNKKKPCKEEKKDEKCLGF